jgi:predicted nucleic acid-binding protein
MPPAGDPEDLLLTTTLTKFCGRTVIVIDAGVAVASVAEDGHNGEAARAILRGERLAAPELIDLEVISGLRGLLRGGKLSMRRAEVALADFCRIPLRRAPHRRLVTRCWELRDNLTAYDASYVALAELLGATLITTDARLSRAPQIKCAIEVLSRARE